MQKIAIIGTGISGAAAGYFLKDKYDIVFYEKNHYAGGHTNTLTVNEEGAPVYIDSGFMVYNEITYPLLTRLFLELRVKTKNTDMSFSVQHRPTGLEYCGTGLRGLFAQRRNLINLKHWKMLLEMDRFNKQAPEVLEDERYRGISLKEYVKEKMFSDDFFNKFLIPISSAVWSAPADKMLDFPAMTLVRFFKNHGFLGLRGHYQWKTVVDGSRCYLEKIAVFFKDKIFLNREALKVRRISGGVSVTDNRGERKVFDKVIMASHADETLGMLENASVKEKSLLSKFPYQRNRAVLHTDESLMPRVRSAWSSWNYRITDQGASTIYWMNNLQHVSKKKNYFISINDTGQIDDSKILWDKEYSHPLFDVESVNVQDQLADLNKEGPVYFCGAYFKYGFHEDGLASGLDAARAIGGEKIWE